KFSSNHPTQIANELLETGLFEYAAPNFFVKPELAEARIITDENNKTSDKEFKKFGVEETTVNDALFPAQWSFKNTGAFTLPPTAPYFDFLRTPYGNYTAGADMQVTFAWDISRGAGINVGLFDDGTQRTHPDLAANISPLGFDPVNVSNLGDLVNGISVGHGTATAGVIAAVANNNIGIAGMSHHAKLIPVQIATANLLTDYAMAYDWGWQTAQMDVICSAWNWSDPLFDAPIVNAALQRAFTQGRGGKGCVLLFPAGNASLNFVQAPSQLSQVISVAATTSDDKKASFSSFGNLLDVSASGTSIVTTDVTGLPFIGFGGYTAGDYVTIDGSSVAVAQAAGIVALMLAANPQLSAIEAREILQGSAEKVGGYTYALSNPNAKAPQTHTWSNELGYGRINAWEAVKIASKQKGCNGTQSLSAAFGYFDDGNILQGYGNNADCRWLIQPTGASSITLQFTDFFLADDNDRILIYNTSDINAPFIGIYTHEDPPPAQITSNTGTMLVRFITDDEGTDRGWRANYSSNAPSADIIANTNSTCVNSPVSFSVANLVGNIKEYLWNFGVGAVPATANTLVPPPVTYQTGGLKTITLTLIGNGGNVQITKPNFIFVSSNPINTLDEGFENTLPNTWRIFNESNQGRSWERIQLPTLVGGFAESRAALIFRNFEENEKTALDYAQLPLFNFTGVANPTVTFDVAYAPLSFVNTSRGNDGLRLEYSLDCGATWIPFYNKTALGSGAALIGGNLATTTSTDAPFVPNACNQWRREFIALPALANQNSVLIRFSNINGFGNNLYVDNVKITNGIAPPTNLTATSISSSEISLTWIDNSPNEAGFVIERSDIAPVFPNSPSFVRVGQVAANVSSFVDSGLGANSIYWYRVSALQPNGIANQYNGQCVVSATTTIGTTTNLLFEDFNASCGTLPLGWTSNLIAGNIAFDFWRVNDDPITTLNYGKLGTPAGGCFAIFDSDRFSAGGGVENVALQSPLINAIGTSSVFLQFDHLFVSDFSAQGIVEVFDGVAWNAVATYQNTTEGSIGLAGNSTPRSISINVSALLANKNTGRVRFRWVGNFGFAWAIDNVRIIGTLGAPTNLVANLSNETQAGLSWRDNTDGEDGFEIERSTTSATAGFTTFNTLGLATGIGSTVVTTDNTLVNGTTYWYRVRSFRGASFSAYSNVVQVTTLLRPTVLTATTLSASTISLTWVENSANETNVVIERSSNPNSGFAPIVTLPANANSFIDSGLEENTSYFYRARVSKLSISSANSNVANATTSVTPASNLVAEAIGQEKILLRWAENINNKLGYAIERSLSATSGFSLLINLPNVSAYVDTDLSPDTRYFYRIYAVSSISASPIYSNTSNALTFPATPTNLVATAVSASSIRLHWEDNSNTETDYIIERAVQLADDFQVIAILKANETTYTDENRLLNGTRYFYRVRAVRGQASSAYSNVTNTLTLDSPIPLAPILKGQAGDRSVLLTWEMVGSDANVAYYEIYGFTANQPLSLLGVSDEKQFLVRGLKNTITYTFRVVAVSKTGASSPLSNSITLRPSIVLGMETSAQNVDFNIYPNPNAGEFKLHFQTSEFNKILEMNLINSLGQSVYRREINVLGYYEYDFTLHELPVGMYILYVHTSNGSWYKKVVIGR
nr:S8 family serine peptidase [Thermoflexibacter sp.]